MAGVIHYNIKNKNQLKQHTQQVVNKTALDLGFTTARKSLTIKIRFKRGASHVSWNSGSEVSSQRLARWLMGGFHAGKTRVPVAARPAFEEYTQNYSIRIKNICKEAFAKSGTIRDKSYKAGVAVMEDMKHKIYEGSLNLAANSGKYAQQKLARYGDIPLVATKSLLNDLEVVIV